MGPEWRGSTDCSPLSTPQEFILSCLARDPARRPSAHSLLFHRVLFEVHSLKLLAAHCFIQHQCEGQASLGVGQGLGSGCRRRPRRTSCFRAHCPVCSHRPQTSCLRTWWRKRPRRRTRTRSWQRSPGRPGPRCSGGEQPAAQRPPLSSRPRPPSPARPPPPPPQDRHPHVLLTPIPGTRRSPAWSLTSSWRMSGEGWSEAGEWVTVRPEPSAATTPHCVPRNGIYPLMNFAAARPLGLPRVLAPPPEEVPKAKTPTPEPFDSETRKVRLQPPQACPPPRRVPVSGVSSPPARLSSRLPGETRFWLTSLWGLGGSRTSWDTPFPRGSRGRPLQAPVPYTLPLGSHLLGLLIR